LLENPEIGYQARAQRERKEADSAGAPATLTEGPGWDLTTDVARIMGAHLTFPGKCHGLKLLEDGFH
jgi:hypothetical protein